MFATIAKVIAIGPRATQEALEKLPLTADLVDDHEQDGRIGEVVSSAVNTRASRYFAISCIVNIILALVLFSLVVVAGLKNTVCQSDRQHSHKHDHGVPVNTSASQPPLSGPHLRYDDHRLVNASLLTATDLSWEIDFRHIGKVEERPDGSAIVTNQFHALHCSNLLRRVSSDLVRFQQAPNEGEAQCWSDWTPPHLDHCAEMLRSYILGSADMVMDRVLIVPKSDDDCHNLPEWKLDAVKVG